MYSSSSSVELESESLWYPSSLSVSPISCWDGSSSVVSLSTSSILIQGASGTGDGDLFCRRLPLPFLFKKVLWYTYRRIPLCRFRVSRYYHLYRSDFYLCISTPSMSKMVNMKQQVSRGDFSCPRHIFYYICYFLCRSQKLALTRAPYWLFRLCTHITWGAKIFQTKIKNKVIYLLSNEQLILYLAQLNPWLFWYELYSIPIKPNNIDNQLFTFNWPAVIMLIVNIIRCVRLKPMNT